MKKTILTLTAIIGISVPVHAVTLSFSSVKDALISFNGASGFSFTDGEGGNDFEITTVPDGAGDSVGLFGNISGAFTIGAVTTSGPLQTAPVSGAGTLSIFDGADTLTADLAWVNMATLGSGGIINTSGTLNLTNIAYTGSVADLVALTTVGAGSGSAVVTFQFNPARSISSLKSTAATNSYSGSLTATPDGGTTASLLGLTMLAFGAGRRFLRK